MTNAVAKVPETSAVERALVQGDLNGLSEEQRLAYYHKVCESLDLNPYTKPFDYIKLNNKLVLYAKKDCADQLRSKHGISIRIVHREIVDGVYEVTARASRADGREDEDVGAVSIKGLSGDALANAHMKALTKAKRRVTLSICGLGFLDESELESIPEVRVASVSSAPPPQIEDKSQAAKPNGKPSVPSGAELEKRITDKDAALVAAGVCKPKEFLNAVSAAGEKKGWSWKIAEWPAGEGFAVAVEATKAFEAAHKKSAPRKATQKTLLLLQSWCNKLQLSPPDIEELCAQRNADSLADLTDEDATELVGELAAAFADKQAAQMANPVPANREPGDEPDDEPLDNLE